MNSKVFERAMFKAESKPTKATSGITQGFDEDYEEEGPENDEMVEEVSKRTPRSPEILMNNLRGDMRSVDARYQELAEMVGEDVAMETPPEILAMLQPQLSAQAAPAGIGALPTQGVPPPLPPGGAPMPTPPGMGAMPPGMPPAPPQMPQGPMPTDQGMPPPQGFAYGGMVNSAPGYGPMSMMAPPMYQGAMAPQGFAKGGIASLPQTGATYDQGVSYSGPVTSGANYVRGAGRNGDSMVAHISPEQHQLLTVMGGGSTTNPKTGLPEHYMGAGMATNLMQRIQPYAQAANQYIGSRMSPVLTPPVMQQGRSTMGTFLPRSVEGMELTYPTLTQRIGMATEPVRNYVANMPATQKAVGALTTIPGGAAAMRAFGSGETVPNMPPSDVPAVISTDSAGNRTYVQPPVAEAPAAPEVKREPTVVETAMAPPTEPKTEAELIDKQAKKGTTENRLEAYMKENLPIFEKYMGGDKEASQIQALFLLADAGLEYATKPGRTGMIALANAFKRMPAGLAQIAAQEDARKTQIKGAALTSGLQTIAAEDKATALLQRELYKKMVDSGEIKPENLGAGLTSYTDKKGQDKGMRVDPKVANSFLESRFTPQVQKDKDGNVTGFDTPYATYVGTGQTLVTDKGTREKIAEDISRKERALSLMDQSLTKYEKAFGPGAFLSNLKNNTLVPVLPVDPNLLTEEQRTQIWYSMKNAVKALARAGDTGNIAVAEQKTYDDLLGDKPGTFWSDSQTALKRMMTIRTMMANDRLAAAAQLGWVNGEIQLEVPNLGTKSDPIPQDKLPYIANLAKANPKGQVYIVTPQGTQQVLLSTFKQ